MTGTRTDGWLEHWDRGRLPYFGARHVRAHYAELARTLRPHLPPAGVVVDFGPGESWHATTVAAACRRLVLCEAAPGVRTALATRFRDVDRVDVLSPAQLDTLDAGSVDLLVAHSVLQYLTVDETHLLLARAARLLRPGGVLLLGDLVDPRTTPLADVWQLVRFAARGGFLPAVLASMATLPVSTYARTRHRHGLAAHDRTTLAAQVARHGLDVDRLERNLGNNAARWTLRGVRRADGAAPG